MHVKLKQKVNTKYSNTKADYIACIEKFLKSNIFLQSKTVIWKQHILIEVFFCDGVRVMVN